MSKILWDLSLNIGILALIANLLTRIKVVKMIFIERNASFLRKTILAAMLGLVCIFSTSTGIHLDNVIVNTRVIGALAAGIIGGPYVGIVAGLIGGVHRFLYNIQGFTTLACSLSTFLAGILGAVIYPYFQRGRWNLALIFAITAFAELLHMCMILLLCRPLEIALQTVETIAIPMILLNSAGMLIFITTIKSVYQEKDLESEAKLRLALSVAEQCLPFFRKGLSREGMSEVTAVIMSSTIFCGAIITDRQNILAMKQVDSKIDLGLSEQYLKIAGEAMNEKKTITVSKIDSNNPLRYILEYYTIIASPLMKMEQPAGCLIVFAKRKWLHLEANTSFVKGLATLFSTQLELSEIDYQKRLRQQAEFSALQSQVNPHLLYNALNTLACVSRENPPRARELLIILAQYYRRTLDSNRHMISLREEIQQVNNYLVLEKARFEEKLEVRMDIPEEIDCIVPTLILQPIVENAIKYGVNKDGHRKVGVKVRQSSRGIVIHVTDGGPGFPPEIMKEIFSDDPNSNLGSKHVGLLNVRKRLQSIFGEESSFNITSSSEGSQVTLVIPRLYDAQMKAEKKEWVQ